MDDKHRARKQSHSLLAASSARTAVEFEFLSLVKFLLLQYCNSRVLSLLMYSQTRCTAVHRCTKHAHVFVCEEKKKKFLLSVVYNTIVSTSNLSLGRVWEELKTAVHIQVLYIKIYIKIKAHSSCEIKDFVETHLCKLCV